MIMTIISPKNNSDYLKIILRVKFYVHLHKKIDLNFFLKTTKYPRPFISYLPQFINTRVHVGEIKNLYHCVANYLWFISITCHAATNTSTVHDISFSWRRNFHIAIIIVWFFSHAMYIVNFWIKYVSGVFTDYMYCSQAESASMKDWRV